MIQRERIIQYIKDFGSITALEATADLGVMQFHARINELEKEGYIFNRKKEKSKNRYGEIVNYMRYSLQ